MSDQTKLDEFGTELARVKADSQMQWAAVDTATPTRRENHFDDVDPSDDGAADEGLLIEYQMASGRTIEEWYDKPGEWGMVSSDLVLLLEYWGIDPGSLEMLNIDSETWEVPLAFDEGEDDFRPNWQEIERTVQTRELEEDDNGE